MKNFSDQNKSNNNYNNLFVELGAQLKKLFSLVPPWHQSNFVVKHCLFVNPALA